MFDDGNDESDTSVLLSGGYRKAYGRLLSKSVLVSPFSGNQANIDKLDVIAS